MARPAGINSLRVLLPAYNEEEALRLMLPRLEQVVEFTGVDADILVVNDGSTDRTAQVVQSFEGRLIVHLLDLPKNVGLGGAMRIGLDHAVNQMPEVDAIIVMDADNTHPPDLIPSMLQEAETGGEVVIASRFQPGSITVGVQVHRRWLSELASYFFRSLVRLPKVRDYTCGYRLYRVDLLKRAFDRYGREVISEPGFACMIELLLKLQPFRPEYREVPMQLRYDQKCGPSKMRVLSTVIATLRLLFRNLRAGGS